MMSKPLLRNLLGMLMVLGIVVALWPLGQSVYANWNQQQLRTQWEKEKRTGADKNQPAGKNQSATASTVTARPPKTAGSKSANSKAARAEWPKTRLVIPDADVDVVVLDGWDDNTLQKAPGHWPSSAHPGQKGNCAIAGHRNVFGSPFYKVDALQPGAPIELRTTNETFMYRVIEVKAVADADTTVIQPSPDPEMPPQLTLVTCTIPRTSTRIIVSAALEASS